MPKLTIDDKDYYTDDFNEKQLAMYNEVTMAQEEMNRLKYTLQVIDARCNMLAAWIVQEAEAETDEAQTSE